MSAGAVSLVYETPAGVASITFDAVPEHSYDDDAEVTDSPVERGASISDHVFALQQKVSLQVAISNTPIYEPPDHMDGVTRSIQTIAFQDGSKASGYVWSGTFDRAKRVQEELHRLKNEGTLLTLITPADTIPNLVIRGISRSRNAQIGRSFQANLTLVEIFIADTETAAVPASARASRRRAAGTQNAEAQDGSGNAGTSLLARLTGEGRRIP